MNKGSVRRRSRALASVFMVMAAALPGSAYAANPVLPFNNVGVTQDPTSNADFDTVGYSYYAPALLLAGVSGGSTVSAEGLQFTWPNVASGQPDNMVADGQSVDITPADGATRIGFLGAADHGPSLSQVTLTYSTTDENGDIYEVDRVADLNFSDWTLNGGAAAPEPGNVAAVTTLARAMLSAAPDPTKTYVFATVLPIDTTMTLKRVTFPPSSSVSGGQMHLFAVTTG